MVGPIAVFRFAFAAYAATASRGEGKDAAATLSPAFMETWLSMGRRGDLRVKVEICDERGGAEGLRLAPEGRATVVWLDDIEQTERGFSGAVCRAEAPLKHVRLGQRIGFDPRDSLDWTIHCDAQSGCKREFSEARFETTGS